MPKSLERASALTVQSGCVASGGVIGASYWRRDLVLNFREVAALVAICNTDSGRAHEHSRKYGRGRDR